MIIHIIINLLLICSVVALHHTEFSVGNTVTMKLMRRERGTLAAVPVEESNSPTSVLTPVSVAESSNNTLYCKLLVATPSQVSAINNL
jgi:hypothetical protein